MKTKILLTLFTINLTLASVAFAQQDISTTGQITIGCPASLVGVQITINDGLQSPPILSFADAPYGTAVLNDPISSAGDFKVAVSDDRGYDSGPGNCGPGFDLTVQADGASQYFNSISTLNDTVLKLGNGVDESLEMQGTDWDTTPDDVGIISDSTPGGTSMGIDETNIHGQPTDRFAWSGSDFNVITLISVDEAYSGEFQIIFSGDDINLDIPSTTPIDTYSKTMVISIT
jgi:hypothetical protein